MTGITVHGVAILFRQRGEAQRALWMLAIDTAQTNAGTMTAMMWPCGGMRNARRRNAGDRRPSQAGFPDFSAHEITFKPAPIFRQARPETISGLASTLAWVKGGTVQ